MLTKRKGRRYIKMLPRGLVKPYILPARGLVIEDTCGIFTLLLEDVLFFPEMLAFMKITDDLVYGSINFEFAPKVFGVPAPIVKCHKDSVLKTTIHDEIRFVKNSLLDIRVGCCCDS